MKPSNFLILLLFIAPALLMAQNKQELTAMLENRVLANDIDVTIFELVENNSKIPTAWQEEINEGTYQAIMTTDVFRKIVRYNILKYTNAVVNAKTTHYLAKLEVIEITVDGKPYKNTAVNPSSKFTIATNFTLSDVLRGTNVVSELIIFSNHGNGKEDKPRKSIRSYHQEVIKKAINKQFPKTYQIANIDEISSPVLLNFQFNQKEIEAGGNPAQLHVYTFTEYVGRDKKSQIPIFEKIGQLTRTDVSKDENILYKIDEGRSQIISTHKKGIDLYITPLLLGK